MTIEFQRWPAELAARYRERGYWLDQPLTRILDTQRQERPDAIAVICGDRQLSYAELDRRASNLASRLSEAGLGQGDTALVQLPNCAEFYIVFFALLKIGVAPVNALFSHRKLEMTSYAQQIEPRLVIGARAHELFADDNFSAELRTLSPRLSLVLLLGGNRAYNDLERWLASETSAAPVGLPSAADEVAFFQLSGGSTGTPKLIPRTHNDYYYSVRVSAEICALGPQTRFLCALPAGHNFLLSSPGALGVFHAGGCVVMAASPEPLSCFALIEKHQVDMVALVPTAVALWLEAAGKQRPALGSLKLMQVGGASFAEALARRVPQELGCSLQQVFGMAEGLVNYTRFDDDDELVFTTQGRPISPDDEIKIVDEDGDPVPEGMSGELATRGPYTFRGYYRSPEHSAKVFDADGFYYSGDVVQKVRGGHLRVVGRVKDQINRGGEKVASEEIENLLLRHPEVTHAALVAMQDILLGEKSCAFIVARDAGLRAPTLRRYLMELGVAEYKLPDRVRFIETMPLTPVGKIDKKRLRAELT
ncbi:MULTISPECIES: (2,3-dihydroxybenzoyl)adenylate synthase [unclassified Bosea (in: a-proteobacteria)]|uniref:(2,3-dihydroxybenzoyl)adenylate synthase n=1 Tax=unclassified Bosea (in: a-proteobacteria) TaxID=2653178 RepID=UPI000F75CD23|nr:MULTISPECIES: (2,3-dihydroxybenzoyl)adenylate synthase [unclassified Bosea (in: a-proteobacteria)]AZO78044.1 2,3-dihydroxybenzoate-AMP ligase [Bosea sp. Tri-49]RXT19195.1 2,3-dihydroxybenzoate-AMP ligase [Bosea sp. Tri-39]RXT41467.1 2,3-dihydroxybenzoate-AMP ligase [Bosea sp. Tri-54]